MNDTINTHREIFLKMIESKSYVRKDVFEGNIKYNSKQEKIIEYAKSKGLEVVKSLRIYDDYITTFITELRFNTINESSFFYNNMDEILK